MRKGVALLLLLLIGAAAGAIYHFTVRGNVKVNETEIVVSPQSFSAELRAGTIYVKKLTVKNYGSEREVYFEYVVEGPDPEDIDVEVHDVHGNTISKSNKLLIPSGTRDNPSEVDVNVHVEVDENAISGDYDIYIMLKET